MEAAFNLGMRCRSVHVSPDGRFYAVGHAAGQFSLWDVAKAPEEEPYKSSGRSLLSYFTALRRGATRLGVAGKVRTPADAAAALAAGADFVLLGRAAIIHHDFPRLAAADAEWQPMQPPVTRAHLAREGLGPAFIDYMAGARWGGFVAE